MSDSSVISLEAALENPPDVVIGESIYVRKGLLDDAELERRYTLDLYASEAVCGKCENRSYRPNEICDPCENYHGRFLFSRDTWLKGTETEYHALPICDIGYVRHAIRQLPDYANLRIEKIFQLKHMRYPLRFTGKLFGANAVDVNGYPRANQQAIAAQWLKYKVGTIKAPPRTGKTVLATYLACELGVKTVIIAHQYKILKQFYDTYMGNPNHPNPNKRRAAMTNAPELERRYGAGSVVHILKNASDLAKFGNNPDDWPDVLLVTVQKFTRRLARVIQFINPHYSFKQVDEYHQAAAHAYARALFKMKQPFSLGLSATPRRKDALDRKSVFTVGPIVAQTETISIPPFIEAKFVQALPDNDYNHWAFACKWARGSEDRNQEIVTEVFNDLAAGHDGIIIPVGKKEQQRYLVAAINLRMKHLKRGGNGWETFPYPIAVEYHGDLSDDAKDSVIDRVDDGRPCVLVSQVTMIKQAIDMEVPSMIYLNEPLSATREVGAPMFEQLSFRVATPSPLKPMEPVVKIWIDNLSRFRNSLNTLYYNEILPGCRDDATPDGPKYRISKSTREVLSNLQMQKRKGGAHGKRGQKNSRFNTRKTVPSGGSWT